MNIDEITYGNPNQEQIKYLKAESYCDVLLKDLATFTFPKNSSDATKEELNYLVDCIGNMQNREEFQKKFITYDRFLFRYFIDGMIKAGEDKEVVSQLVMDIAEDTKPLLIKLKFHFQRPRPYQLAQYYKLKLFPFHSITSDSPSFPSGHAFQAKLITEVLGNRYPQSYAFMQDAFMDISYSRIFMGLHYQSDLDVGIFAAEKVLELKEFKVKYKL
jgi:hypothetical protein